MQEARSLQQSTLKEKLYYVSKEYIVQDSTIYGCPILYERNGGGSSEKIQQILKMCGMEITSKENERTYKLEVKRDG